METTAMTIETLNDLIEINNDRIEGYEKARKELEGKDADLEALFLLMIDESHTYKVQLAAEVAASGKDIATSTTGSGKIYRAWMDVKAIFTGHDRKAVLENCEFGEDAAQKAYTSALDDEELPAYIRSIVSEQQQKLKASHDKIKALRDAEQ